MPRCAKAASLALALKGMVDLATEDLTLTSIDGAKGKGIALGAEGIKIHGFQKVPWIKRTANIVVNADMYVLDQASAYWQGLEPKNLGGLLTAYLVMTPAQAKAGAVQLSGNLLAPSMVRIDPQAKSRTAEPIAASFVGIYEPELDRLSTEVIRLVTRYATIDSKGTIDSLTTKRIADLQGTLTPDWKSLTTILASATAPGASLTGGAKPFHIKGPLAGDSLAAIIKGLDAEIGIDLKSAETFGMNLGPAPIVIRATGGATTIDPIRTTLNNGKVNLKPTLAVDAIQGIALQFLPNSTIQGAEINDEVSRQVLRYIAPVLDNATHVRGKVSISISQADIPLTGPPSHTMTLTGDASFQDVCSRPASSQARTVCTGRQAGSARSQDGTADSPRRGERPGDPEGARVPDPPGCQDRDRWLGRLRPDARPSRHGADLAQDARQCRGPRWTGEGQERRRPDQRDGLETQDQPQGVRGGLEGARRGRLEEQAGRCPEPDRPTGRGGWREAQRVGRE